MQSHGCHVRSRFRSKNPHKMESTMPHGKKQMQVQPRTCSRISSYSSPGCPLVSSPSVCIWLLSAMVTIDQVLLITSRSFCCWLLMRVRVDGRSKTRKTRFWLSPCLLFCGGVSVFCFLSTVNFLIGRMRVVVKTPAMGSEEGHGRIPLGSLAANEENFCLYRNGSR